MKLWIIELADEALEAIPSSADYHYKHVVLAESPSHVRSSAQEIGQDEIRHVPKAWLDLATAKVTKLGDATGVYGISRYTTILCTESVSHG